MVCWIVHDVVQCDNTSTNNNDDVCDHRNTNEADTYNHKTYNQSLYKNYRVDNDTGLIVMIIIT